MQSIQDAWIISLNFFNPSTFTFHSQYQRAYSIGNVRVPAASPYLVAPALQTLADSCRPALFFSLISLIFMKTFLPALSYALFPFSNSVSSSLSYNCHLKWPIIYLCYIWNWLLKSCIYLIFHKKNCVRKHNDTNLRIKWHFLHHRKATRSFINCRLINKFYWRGCALL